MSPLYVQVKLYKMKCLLVLLLSNLSVFYASFFVFFVTLLFLLLAKVQSGREECGGGKDLLIKLLLKYLLLCVNLYVLN